MNNTTDGNTQYALGERVHYKYYGVGIVRECVETENGMRYLIEFERVMAWMTPNHLLERMSQQEAKWMNKHSN